MTEQAPAAEKPDEPSTPEAVKPGAQPSEPAGDQTDWKAESRKWEALAKKDKDDAEAWRKHQLEQQSEDEKRAARERELEERAAKAERALLRSTVADDKKVPVEWRKFITGTTQEELEASADEILTLIAAKGTTPDPTQGQQAATPPGDFLRESLSR